MGKREKPLSVAEQIIVERLKALDYSALKKLEDRMIDSWGHYQSIQDNFEDSVLKAIGYKMSDISNLIDYYSSALQLIREATDAYIENIFGPAPSPDHLQH
ncbi:hypothetical protein [Chitinophaga varians]|uniref:hypothetical protein n=1 Tax=Chitinophaga varians TaxID=2202339 RepID=UPI00165FF132|nr:hypothetical protein [Chitinophaga varians]MBC9912762.1 hypothetical protein [Chitinophaga varians]